MKGFTYSESEIRFISAHVNSLHPDLMAEKLNRSVHAIYAKVQRMRLKFPDRYKDRYVGKKVLKMKALINVCETTKSPYIKDKAKEQLRILSGI